jgi:hypothetical protein
MNPEDQKKADRIEKNYNKNVDAIQDQMQEAREAARVAAHLAGRDQNDADVQEIARQVGVFCRGLDEAGVKHGYLRNSDRSDAVQFFILTEVQRLRDKQSEED